MWFEHCTFYHIYPLGFCDAPQFPDGNTLNRLQKIVDWIDYLKTLNIKAVYFGPIFESDKHGYDTRDYRTVDPRLGTNEDFKTVADQLHQAGIKLILDGVFNHVGRGFWAFQDLIKNRENSPYRDWFFTDFNRNSNDNDGFWYEGWEGHFDLVKLNLHNHDVVNHLLESVKYWIDSFGIDGLRLDVAYSLDREFMKKLRSFVKDLDPEFFLLGEIIHGDYNQLLNDGMLDSCTNYEGYKGLYSSFNDKNMFEIAYSLNRQFGEHGLYRGKLLSIFADNHDVNRIASTLKDEQDLPLLYALMFTMPGIPFIYYGSEWGTAGIKQNGNDSGLRPSFDQPVENELGRTVSLLADLRTKESSLAKGNYQQLHLTNEQLVFSRTDGKETILTLINASGQSSAVSHHIENRTAKNLLTGEMVSLNRELTLAGNSFLLLKVQ